jgi:uncharacterized protein involved in outer membrane biogenesis
MKRIARNVLRTIAVLAGLLALAIALLSVFDWNRAKPWLSEKVRVATERSFVIDGDLALHWQRPLQAATGWKRFVPWPHLQATNVVLGNAAWATTGPDMARISQIDFTVDPLALLSKSIIVHSLQLRDPVLVLEQGKGSAANWQFPHQTQSAWQFQIKDLGLENGNVRYVDPEKKADFTTRIDSQPDGSVRWQSQGKFSDKRLRGSGSAGAILSLQSADIPYPVRANVVIGTTTVDLDGTLTNPAQGSALDVKLKILGASMADLFPISGLLLPETPKFSTEGRLIGSAKPGAIDLRYENFNGQVGSSDLRGTLAYRQKQPRSELRGDVVSQNLNLKDLRSVIGGGDDAASRAEAKQPPGKVLPVSPFKTDRWKTMDVQVQFTGQSIQQPNRQPVRHLFAKIGMQDGVLSLAPLEFDLAGGRLATTLHIDGRHERAIGSAKISGRGLNLNELLPAVEATHSSAGQLHLDATLSGSGNSVAALLGDANGDIHAVVAKGSVSKFVLEAAGLNLGAAVLAKLFGDQQVQLNCMVADFGAKHGIVRTRTFLIDTQDALIAVDGNINLSTEQLALKVNPSAKGVRVISLRSPLHVAGTFSKPDIGVDKGPVALKAGAALALGALATPLAALLALIKPGADEPSPCAGLLKP